MSTTLRNTCSGLPCSICLEDVGDDAAEFFAEPYPCVEFPSTSNAWIIFVLGKTVLFWSLSMCVMKGLMGGRWMFYEFGAISGVISD